MSSRIKRACIISGGGAWGAYGAGTLARLNNDYDTVIGISSGAIMSPFIALKEWEYLKIFFTDLNDKKIYDNCWFEPKLFSENGRIKRFPIIITLLLNRKTVTTTNKLRQQIDELFKENFYIELQKQSKEVLIGIQNYAEIPPKAHYFNSLHENFEDLKDWIWCGSNFPFFASLVTKSWNDNKGNFHVGQWCNGKLAEFMAIDQLFGKRFTDVDIIFSRTRTLDKYEGNEIRGFLDNIFTTASLVYLRTDMENEFLYKKIEKLNNEGTKVNVYWLPRKLSPIPLIFDSKELLKWWEEGYVTAYDENRRFTFNPIKEY